MKTHKHLRNGPHFPRALQLAVLLASTAAGLLPVPRLSAADPERPGDPPWQERPAGSGRSQAAEVLDTVLRNVPGIAELFMKGGRDSDQKQRRAAPHQDSIPAQDSSGALFDALGGESPAQVEGQSGKGGIMDATSTEALIASIVQAPNLTALREAVRSLKIAVPDPGGDPGVARAVQTTIRRFPRATEQQRRAAIAVVSQLLRDDRQYGMNKATLLCAIRTLSLQVTSANTASEVAKQLARHERDLRMELSLVAVDQALSSPEGLIREEWVPHLRKLMVDWNAVGARQAAERLAQAASRQGGGAAALEWQRGGSASAAGAALVGSWSAGIIGEARGMSHSFQYTFHPNGSYSRTARSSYDFGPHGSALGSGVVVSGTWILNERALRLVPSGGQPMDFQITSQDSKGMITRRPNGDRWIWTRRN